MFLCGILSVSENKSQRKSQKVTLRRGERRRGSRRGAASLMQGPGFPALRSALGRLGQRRGGVGHQHWRQLLRGRPDARPGRCPSVWGAGPLQPWLGWGSINKMGCRPTTRASERPPYHRRCAAPGPSSCGPEVDWTPGTLVFKYSVMFSSPQVSYPKLQGARPCAVCHSRSGRLGRQPAFTVPRTRAW